MSFGFSVGDFIAVADKAWLVYKKCKDAPNNYADLTHHVEILQHVLNDTRAFLEEAEKADHIPASNRKLASLVSARNGCSTTLDEVDDFLDKYSSLGTNQKRFIELFKFITKDSEGLKVKLKHNAELLQLSLVSLTSLSISKVQQTLDTILTEYRSGARQPTVLSHAILENKPVDQKELLVQVVSDLEDKDIHPDSISLNKRFLLSWLSKVAFEGGLDELPPQALRPVAEGASLMTRNSPDTVPDESAAEKSAFVHGDDHLYADPDEALALPSADDVTPPSPSDSTSSYRSKPEDWHPSDKPDPNYVHSMLRPLFEGDPSKAPDPDASLLRIKRAFHQQDWGGQDYLTRNEVLQLCKDVLEQSKVDLDVDRLQRMVLSFDANRDGQFDKEEFIALMQGLIQAAANIRIKSIKENFDQLSSETRQLASSRRRIDTEFFLPWGWSPSQPGSTVPYVDTIRGTDVSIPPKLLEATAFSVIAREADICVAKIGDFQQKWIGTVPKSLQSEFLRSLKTVRMAALNFTIFENQENPLLLSDLDAALVCYQLASKLLDEAETGVFGPSYAQLESTKSKSYSILGLIQGFSHCLGTFSAARIEPTAQSFPIFRALWKSKNLEWYAKYIAKETEDWNVVREAVLTCRKDEMLSRLEPRAIAVAEDYLSTRKKRKTELQALPWSGRIVSAELSGWDMLRKTSSFDSRNVFLKITVSEPPQTFKTSPKKRAGVMSWELRQALIKLLPTSQLTISIMYSDSKLSKDTLKHEFEPYNIITLNFYLRAAQGYKIREYIPCNVVLTIQMDNQTEIASELTSLEDSDWMDLLSKKPTLDDEANSNSALRPDWEQGLTPEGRVYYIDHRTKTTTWVRPTS